MARNQVACHVSARSAAPHDRLHLVSQTPSAISLTPRDFGQLGAHQPQALLVNCDGCELEEKDAEPFKAAFCRKLI